MTDHIALKLHSTTDAAVWTDTFFQLHGHRLADIDWGLMVSWFANAIAVGREAGRSSEAARYEQRCDTTDNGRRCLHYAGHGGDHRYAQPRKAQP